jgi:hypothetical protein
MKADVLNDVSSSTQSERKSFFTKIIWIERIDKLEHFTLYVFNIKIIGICLPSPMAFDSIFQIWEYLDVDPT